MTFNRGGWNDEPIGFIVFILIKFMLIRLFKGWLLAYICLWLIYVVKFSILSNFFLSSAINIIPLYSEQLTCF